MKGKWLLNLRLLLILVSVSFFFGQESLQAEPSPSVAFTHGVASGDVTPISVVLWTRVDGEAELKVEVSTRSNFRRKIFRQTVLATAENDFTAKVRALVQAADSGAVADPAGLSETFQSLAATCKACHGVYKL